MIHKLFHLVFYPKINIPLFVFWFYQELMELALSLASEGDSLIENSHYAEDSIRPKCGELRGVCEEIGSTLRSKKGLLLRALELHHALEKVPLLK